jgi:hypothetical protein
MTFDELTYGICFLMPLFFALSEGRKAGFVGILIGLIIGVGFGVGCFYSTRALFKWVRRQPELGKRNPNGFWMIISWILCVMMFIFIGGISVLGMFAVKLAISYVVA